MHFNGLTDKQVEESRKKYGSNVIPDSEPTTFWAEFKETFKDPMIRILLAIAALMIVMCVLGYAEIYEPIGTVVAVLIVAFVSAKTGVASDTKYRQLKDSTKKDQCKVYRNGLVTVIDVDDVVVGDKVLLQSGDKVPADGVLIHGTLRVDNSALNGEAEECPKTAADESFPLPEDITGDTFVDAHSLFRGAVLFDGEGVLDVRKVGLATMMGKMAEEMQDDEPDSPLKVKLGKLADMISRFGYIGAVVIAIMYFGYFILSAGGFAAYFSSGAPVIIQDIVEAVSLAVVIIVCAVPEGLPLMISLVLMQNTSKMLDHNVLVRKAEGIETAGSLNILFSDKTGTITKGHLEVVEFFTADGVAIPLDQLAQQTKLKGLIDLAIGKNSQSMYDGSGRVVGGNATDQALMRFLGQETFHKLDEVSSYAVTKSQSFNSANKFSQAYIAGAGRTFYKGAPEKFLAVAQKYLSLDGDEHPLDLESLNAKIDELAGKSMRVLAFGYSPSEMTENAINADTVLIGLVGIRDDVRPEAREAIAEVQKAGIQVVMITGDRLETAVAIAREAGLLRTRDDVALTSTQLNELSDDEVKKIIPRIRVIARALPTDKSRMVRLCQELNLVVGMTGDTAWNPAKVAQYAAEGCDSTAFLPIVSYGAHAADPHHEADQTRLKAGDCIVIDMGCRKNRYCSDMTRTFFCRAADPKYAAIHDLVREANELAESMLRPGVPLCDLDKAARDHISAAGYGEYFTHRLGHFIGQTEHEKGDVSATNTTLAKPGMIFSIEPGVYLPGEFGVRVEDLVLVTEDGCEILNHVDKHWKTVG
jgi:Ca2+-transporting ATPase